MSTSFRGTSGRKRMLLGGLALAAALLPSLVRADETAPAATPPATSSPTPVVQPSAPVAPLTGVPAAICAKLSDLKAPPFEATDRADAVAFYQGRQCRPLWTDDHGLTHAADLVIAELGRAGEWGLDASAFKLSGTTQQLSAGQWTPDQLAAADLEITAAALLYAHQAEGSRIPNPEQQLSDYLDRQPAITPTHEVLARIADKPNPDEALRSFEPSNDQFMKLKALLATLRGVPKEKTAQVFIAKRGPMLSMGARDPDVATLKQRFAISSQPGSEQLFDDALVAAIKRFQASKDLSDDGIVGPTTRAALSGEDERTPTSKIDAVIANMEEWRWMPRSLGDAHVLVNVPSFTIALTDNGKTLFDDRVVVGTPDKQTPIFSKDMKSIVLRPRWNIPDSIKLSMLLSGRSIESQGYTVLRNGRRIDSTKVDWTKANLSAYTFYQPAGDDNALGNVKLLFPNKHSVYLHDTPSKSLFDEPVRLYSHGCMRVRNPQDFAQRVFDIDRGDAAPDVKQLIRKGPMDNEIALDHPLPVHVGYFTVWVDDAGEAHYYNDWYGHQKRITLALAGKWDEIDVTRIPEVDTAALKQVRIGKSDTPDDDSSRGPYQKYNGTVGDTIRQALGY